MQRIKSALIMTLLAYLTLFTHTALALSGLDGTATSFDSVAVKGKWTVVEAWASDCRVCRASIHETIDFAAGNPDVAVIGISLDGATASGKANAQKFIDEFGLTFNNLLSNPTEFSDYLSSTHKRNFIGTPTFMLYDPQGTLHAV
ncbi:MAG: TlpA family protein disulfide reductase, partial [Thiothrix sp.]